MSVAIRDARRRYAIEEWGNGYFDVSAKGHLTVHPLRTRRGVDLRDLVLRLRRRHVRFPALIRFPQILESRVEEIFAAFGRAIGEFNYPGVYHGVYPIKVNQVADVVAALVRAGAPRGMGLEAGSRAELAMALAQDLSPQALVICNGYKDPRYVRLALRGSLLGYQVFLIVEKPEEIPLVIEESRALGIQPLIGIRIRLRSRGSGKWEKSSGAAAKFGLTTQELLDAVDQLREAGMLEAFRMLHFHAGSQITEIKRIKDAVKEGARVYAKLRALGCPLEWLDVGGGLGVDYDGSNTSYEASMNYTVTEYANDVVYSVREICNSENVPPPNLTSESGRALTAYHALLISEVRSRNTWSANGEIIVPADAHEAIQELLEIWQGMTRKNHREFFHDAEAMREELNRLFDLGYLSLRDRALGERLLQRVGQTALEHARRDRFLPDEFEVLEKRLVAKYIANFSVFQSIPDSWALDQLFPVVPIHRLNEEPTVPVTLCDVTCDSDGEIDRFVDMQDVKRSLELHELQPGEPYYIAITLIGAYQDVLGDYHNLFGRADEAHVILTKKGTPRIVKILPGNQSHEVLRLFDHDPEAMAKAVEQQAAERVAAGSLSRTAARALLKEFRQSLSSFTYLDFPATPRSG